MRRQHTIRINQGYVVDSKWEALALVARALRRIASVWWQYRTETGLLTLLLAVRVVAGRHLVSGPAWWVTAGLVTAAVAVPGSRRVLAGRLACARTRRRLLACMRETRVATSAGRLPLALRSRTTPAGERLTFGLFPGQSAELLDARTEELRAAARARDVTVTRDPARADRVTVDVIRRDSLAGPPIPSPLLRYAAALHDSRSAPTSPAAAPAADAAPAPVEEIV